MANRSMSAVVRKVEDAEKIIQSYAYGADLDRAIAYLQEHDPKNAVLATIKDFENDRPMLKALNALYRADEARKNNDKAELEKVAKFLSLSENEELRSEAINIMRNLPDNPVSTEQAELINETLNAAKENAEKKEDAAVAEKREMSDDEIFANANEISSLMNDENFQKYVMNEAVKPAQEKVTVTDDAGNVVDEETSDNLWIAKMMSALQEVTMTRMDDADFAAKSKEDKAEALKSDVVDNFWIDLYGMAGASAMDPNKSYKENELSVDEIVKKFNNGGKVSVKSDHFVNSVVSTKRKMDDKAVKLAEQGKNKSGSWLKRASQKFGKFVKDYIGTWAETKQAAIGYFSSARGITNTAATVGLIGSAFVSLPVALAAAGTYGLYHAVSAPQWNILEKRNANLKLARASGNTREIKVWEGKAGLKHAYNAIQASPKEKARFDRLKKINLRAGLGSAAIVAAATPFVLSGGIAALGLGAAATWGVARLAASTARVAGANTNSYLQMKEAIRQDKEDQTEESAKGAKRAKGAFWVGLVASGLAEYLMTSSVADAAAQDHAMGLTNGANSAGQDGSWNAPWQQENPDAGNSGADNGGASDVAPAAAAVVVPDEWNSSMGITEAQWNEMHDKFTGIFKDRAAIFGMDNKQPNLTWQNMYQNIENAKAEGALPNNMTDEQIMYKYMKLVENTERAEPVAGTRYLRTMLDADKEPMYWVDQKEMRALNHIILCGTQTDVSAADLAKSLARITDNGVYVGEGAGIGVTHNRFVGFGRGEDCPEGTNNVNAWERIKGAVRRVVASKDPVVEQPVVIEEKTPVDAVIDQQVTVTEKPAVDNNVSTDVKVTDKPVQDANVDDGARIGTKHNIGRTDTGNDGQLNTTNQTSYHRGRDLGTGVIPGSIVNAGREI